MAPHDLSEYALARRIARILWPETGFSCWTCAHKRCKDVPGRPRMLECLRCHHQSSILRGTALANTKLPLRVWYERAQMEDEGIKTTRRVADQLNVSRSTAWTMQQRLMKLLGEADHQPLVPEVIVALPVRRPHPNRPRRPSATGGPVRPKAILLGPKATRRMHELHNAHLKQPRHLPCIVHLRLRVRGASAYLDVTALPDGYRPPYTKTHDIQAFLTVLTNTHRKVSLRWLHRWVAYYCWRWTRFTHLPRHQGIDWWDRFAHSVYVPLHHLVPDCANSPDPPP